MEYEMTDLIEVRSADIHVSQVRIRRSLETITVRHLQQTKPYENEGHADRC